MSPQQVRLLDDRHRRLAGGGLEWARRRTIARLVLRRLLWRCRVQLSDRLKRALDVAGALALVLACAPLLVLIAVAIKLEDGGPVLFRQVRVGRHGRRFVMLKFRSMVPDAEARKADLLALNEMPDGILFKIRRDPRVTRVGRIIRKLSFDELPQLFNVLRGEMSLVGPRPPVPSEVALYDPAHRRRLAAMPGITGLWQISGRNNIDFQGQVQLDVTYIERQTLALDLAILVRTIPAVLTGKGAS
ncbi:MAG TPA: sugar transferase [Methylomirabilota bacterium]|nr:sugar transferase [Methylomirabilota bacterium]